MQYRNVTYPEVATAFSAIEATFVISASRYQSAEGLCRTLEANVVHEAGALQRSPDLQ